MRCWVMVLSLLCAACGGEQVNSGQPDAGASSDVGLADEVDTTLPDPPQNLAPCEATTCRPGVLGGTPCSIFSVSDDFGSGEYGVHAYSSMVWDGAQTRISVESTGGEWTPVIVLARVNGEVLFDGDVGAVRPPFDVESRGASDLTISSVQATGIVIYVTSLEALESDFSEPVPAAAGYTLTVEPDCGERLRCFVDARDVGEPECGWLHYVGTRVVGRLEGARDEQLMIAARVAWWSLRAGRMAVDNPIVASECAETELGPLDECAGNDWNVGLAAVSPVGRDIAELEELASRLYDGAMPSGVLRTTANEAGLAREQATAVMTSENALRASWLLRNSAVGFSVQDSEVDRDCVTGNETWCFGSASEPLRLYAANRDAALRSMEDLHALFDQMSQ